MPLSSLLPRNLGRFITRCKALCLAPSLEARIPSIPAIRLPNLYKCSISLMRRRIERRIEMVLHLTYLLPTSQAPLPFLLFHLISTSWDLERHPLSHLSHCRPFHQTSLLLVALGHHHLPLSPQRSILTQFSNATYLWAPHSLTTLIAILAIPNFENGSTMDDQQVAHASGKQLTTEFH